MTITAVVFDLDGTLVDTLGDIASAMNAALARRGHATYDEAIYAPWVGEGVANLADRALGGGTPGTAAPEEIAAVVTDYRALYDEHMLDRTCPFAGVHELLEALSARGIELGVLSNKSDPATQAIVAHLFPGRFRSVLGLRPTHAAKPDPSGARAVCAELGVVPARAALVGDTEIDVATAKAAGMRALAATWGMRPRAKLEGLGAHALIDRPSDVLDHLDP